MNNLTSTMTVLAFSISPLLAVGQDTVTYSTRVPLAISVEAGEAPTQVVSGEVMSMQWRVYSNNAFRYRFSGTAKDETGNELAYPLLYKQEVDASGQRIPGQYDALDTRFGVMALGYESIQRGDHWGEGKLAAGSALDLVRTSADPLSPSGSMGRIMSADATNEARIALYAKGIADNASQSGLYQTEVMLTVSADEQ